MASTNAFKPSEVSKDILTVVGKAMRGLVTLDNAAARSDRSYQDKADALIGDVAHGAAVYVYGELDRFPTMTKDQRTAFLKVVRKTYNASATATLGKDAPKVKRDRFSKIHAALEHPATAKYGRAWRVPGMYGTVIPKEDGGDGKAVYSLKAASDIITLANKAAKEAKAPEAPEAAFRKAVDKLTANVEDKAAWLHMATGILAEMLKAPAPEAPAPAPKAPKAAKAPKAKAGKAPAHA